VGPAGLTDDVPNVNAAVLRAVYVHVDQSGLCPFTNEHPVLLGLIDAAVPDNEDEEDVKELSQENKNDAGWRENECAHLSVVLVSVPKMLTAVAELKSAASKLLVNLR
jgi:hypothetical protein